MTGLMKQTIAQLGAAVLRQKAAKIRDFNSPEFSKLIDDMLCTLEESDGVGLAAPQISHSVCVLVIASRPNARYPDAPVMNPVVMINPEFKPLSEITEKDWEGCLSIPGIRALVPRYQKILIDYQDVDGKLQLLELSGFVARIFQHEYDHLQGLVYLDRVEDNRDIFSESEFLKLASC